MKRRIVAKKNKKDIENFILNPLKNAGIKLNYVKFLDGYFIFDFGKNSVCHFRMKGLPYILFGVWKTSSGFDLFAEDSVHLDKFKPTACTNFTVDELIGMLNAYKNKEITLKDIITNYLGYDYDRYIFVDCYDFETGDEIHSMRRETTPEEFEEIYKEEYEEEMFCRYHSYLNKEEFEIAEKNIKKYVDELIDSPYIEALYVHRHLPFFKHWASIEVIFSDKCNEMSDEEFVSFTDDYYNKIRGKNENGDWNDTFISFEDTVISNKGSYKFAHYLINEDRKNWTIYKEYGKRV